MVRLFRKRGTRKNTFFEPSPTDLAGTFPVEIEPLFYPVRFDAAARLDFLAMYDANRDLYAKDFEAFLRLAWDADYRYYFQLLRSRKGGFLLSRVTGRLRKEYAERVRSFVALLEGVRARGFDPTTPVKFRRLRGPARTREGKLAFWGMVPWDGYHRLSVLRYTGRTHVPAEAWRFDAKSDPAHTGDYTLKYIKAGRLTPERHFEYLRAFYGRPSHRGFRELVEEGFGPLLSSPWSGSERERRLLELLTALRVDLPLLGEGRAPWLSPWLDWAARAEAAMGKEPR
jgi:hypothetical protein